MPEQNYNGREQSKAEEYKPTSRIGRFFNRLKPREDIDFRKDNREVWEITKAEAKAILDGINEIMAEAESLKKAYKPKYPGFDYDRENARLADMKDRMEGGFDPTKEQKAEFRAQKRLVAAIGKDDAKKHKSEFEINKLVSRALLRAYPQFYEKDIVPGLAVERPILEQLRDHRNQVIWAYMDGKPVLAEVLVDYAAAVGLNPKKLGKYTTVLKVDADLAQEALAKAIAASSEVEKIPEKSEAQTIAVGIEKEARSAKEAAPAVEEEVARQAKASLEKMSVKPEPLSPERAEQLSIEPPSQSKELDDYIPVKRELNPIIPSLVSDKYTAIPQWAGRRIADVYIHKDTLEAIEYARMGKPMAYPAKEGKHYDKKNNDREAPRLDREAVTKAFFSQEVSPQTFVNEHLREISRLIHENAKGNIRSFFPLSTKDGQTIGLLVGTSLEKNSTLIKPVSFDSKKTWLVPKTDGVLFSHRGVELATYTNYKGIDALVAENERYKNEVLRCDVNHGSHWYRLKEGGKTKEFLLEWHFRTGLMLPEKVAKRENDPRYKELIADFRDWEGRQKERREQRSQTLSVKLENNRKEELAQRQIDH